MRPQEANCSVSDGNYAPARRNQREIRPLVALLIDAAWHKGTLIASTVFLRTVVVYEAVVNQNQTVSLSILSNLEDERPYVYKGSKLRLSDGK